MYKWSDASLSLSLSPQSLSMTNFSMSCKGEPHNKKIMGTETLLGCFAVTSVFKIADENLYDRRPIFQFLTSSAINPFVSTVVLLASNESASSGRRASDSGKILPKAR